MKRELRSHWKRTGLSTRRIIENDPAAPAGLTVAMVNDWIANKIHEARADHWQFVLTKWASFPDGEYHRQRRASRQKGPGRPRRKVGEIWIPLTAEMSAQFISEMARANADFDRDILCADNAPEGLTLRVMRAWRYRHVKTTRRDHWEFVMARLAAMPNFKSKFGEE
ncbi:MAG: hypothetical protein IPM41_10575 [Sphingomonadales bacterium]|nr:hypothetical protein [Sphingomonadales bacterium]